MRNPILPFAIAVVAAFATVPAASAEQVAVVPPSSWSVHGCASWNCAVSTMVMGNGNPLLIVLPTRNAEWPWIVLRREQSGGVQAPDNTFPYEIEVFDSLATATARYASFERSREPMMVTTPDGMTIVVFMRQTAVTRGRAVGR